MVVYGLPGQLPVSTTEPMVTQIVGSLESPNVTARSRHLRCDEAVGASVIAGRHQLTLTRPQVGTGVVGSRYVRHGQG